MIFVSQKFLTVESTCASAVQGVSPDIHSMAHIWVRQKLDFLLVCVYTIPIMFYIVFTCCFGCRSWGENRVCPNFDIACIHF